jgi:hypothetical protein
MGILQFFKSGGVGNVVQTAVSMDDDEADGCTIVVPGFQNRLEEWWSGVVKRLEGRDRFTHSVEKIYRQWVVEKYGGFIPMVCKRGDARMMLS